MTLSLKKLNNKEAYKTIFFFSLPPMISMLIQSLYNIVDSIFVGQISNDATTAISLVMPLQNIILAFAVGTGVGVSSLLSRKLGQKDYSGVQRTIIQGFYLVAITSIIFIIVGIFSVEWFFNIFTKDELILNMCYEYTYVIIYFSFFQLLHIMIEKIMQANGKMVFPMLMQGVGAIVNIILDPIFIFNLGLGVQGAAIATIIGQGTAMLLSLIFLFIVKFEFKISFKNIKPSFSLIKDIYKVGFSSIMLISLTSILMIFLNDILATYSKSAVNVYGLYFKLQTFIFMPVSGLTQGIMPILAYNYGGKMKDNIRIVLKNSLIITTIIMLIGIILFELIPGLLLKMFNPNDEVLNLGINALRIIAISFIPAGIAIILPTLFQAMGKGLESLIVFILRQFIITLPLAYILFNYLSLNGIWISIIIAEVVSAFISLIFYKKILRKDEVLNS